MKFIGNRKELCTSFLVDFLLFTSQKRKVGFTEQFHTNTVELEGIITKIWQRGEDVFARVATYDEHAEILEPAKNGKLLLAYDPGGKNG